MSDSNGAWGDAMETVPHLAGVWDKALPLGPDSPEWVKQLATERGMNVLDLARAGARLGNYNGRPALVWLFPDGLKYRTLDGAKITPDGVTWERVKIIRCREGMPRGVIVAEGETDGAQLAKRAPKWDVAVLPAGAKAIKAQMVAQLAKYDQVLIALDNDEAGEAGATKLMTALPGAVRILPPDEHTDWCEAAAEDKLTGWKPEKAIASREVPVSVFSVGQVLDADLGTKAENNWFADGILPVRGFGLIHAKKKSGKSWILMDLLRALSTGTAAFGGGYDFIHPGGPVKTLLIQLEVLPFPFQERLLSVVAGMPDEQRALYRENAFTLDMGNNKVPRLKIGQPDFEGQIMRAVEASGAQVVAFDPIQRLTGSADVNQAHEMEAILDLCARLQQEGLTVVACHHNNKASGKNERDADAMTGSQRFSGDADSICSVWYDQKFMPDDDNPERIKQRGMSWTLRNGAAAGRLMTIKPSEENDDLAVVRFEPLPAAASTKSKTPAGDQPDIF